MDMPEIPEPDYSSDDDEVHNNESCSYEADPKAYLERVINKLEKLSKDELYRFFPSIGSDDIDIEIPEPDYQDDDEEDDSAQVIIAPQHIYQAATDTELISPKKLANPCLESKQHKALHRELLQIKKMGINVLQQKPELLRALEQRRERQKLKEREEYLRSKRTSFDLKLEEQANKINLTATECKQDVTPINEDNQQPEFLKVHSKINKSKSDS